LSVHDARLSVLDYKSFFAPLFFKKAVEVKGEQPLSPSADGETLLAQCFLRAEKRVRKATAFRGRTNKTVLPCESGGLSYPFKCSGGTFETHDYRFLGGTLTECVNLSVTAFAVPPPLKRGGFRWGG
jgi:hypothetical protein